MISVVIPLYNKKAIIERTLRSVLSQDYDDFEVVIVDDGSTDGSADIAQSLKDERIRFFSQENAGPSKARNTGVRHAKGEWIVFLDADDEMLPGALLAFKKSIETNVSSDFITCSYKSVSDNGDVFLHVMKDEKVKNPFKEAYFYHFHTRTGSAIYKKQLLVETPFNEKLRRYEDFDVWFRLYRKVNVVTCSEFVLQENVKYGDASKPRENIEEDFVGHLSFKGKKFWEKMCLYKLYLGERENYSLQIKKKYPWLHVRYDLLFLHKMLQFIYG